MAASRQGGDSRASPTRGRPIEPAAAALLVVDVQKGICCAGRRALPDRDAELALFREQVRAAVVPNGERLIAACRAAGVEVIYTVIESLALDGRDRSLDHRISGILVPRGSADAQVVDALCPEPNDIVVRKTASGVFNATNIEYVLRNLGIEYLLVMGVMTDQCVESAVRDACDRGFLVTLIEDACATTSAERHAESLRGLSGYCRIRRSAEVVAEVRRLVGGA